MTASRGAALRRRANTRRNGRAAAAFAFLAVQFFTLLPLALAGCVSESPADDPAHAAEAKAIEFLKREVPAWSRDNHCFSCHNNGDAARALYAAHRKGHRIPSNALADTTRWVMQPDQWEHNKGDPGFTNLRLANIQFAGALLAALDAGHTDDREPLRKAARKLAADQDADGSWPIERQNAAGSPATYGSTLATHMALRVLKRADLPETRAPARRAEDWLRQMEPENIVTAATLLLAFPGERRDSAGRTKDLFEMIQRAQSEDGGWGPYADSPPEAFDTALVLLALAELAPARKLQNDHLIRRGRSFLAAMQNPDGSWPPSTRPPGGNSYAQRLSTTGWAALALMVSRDP